jgi:MFS transporter, DHA1 family, inner membrane transport protein
MALTEYESPAPEGASIAPDSEVPDTYTGNRSLGWQLACVILSRFFLNTARRFCYPFAPAMARGLGVALPTVTSIIALNQLTAMFGFLIGPIADRHGYRFMMLFGLSLLGIGMCIGGAFSWVWALAVALFCAGVGKAIFDPVTQAFLGEQVPYHRRGLAIGISETAWAGSSLIGIPLMGLLIDRYSWQAPFWMLGAAGVFAMGIIFLQIPNTRAAQPQTIHQSKSSPNQWINLFRHRPAVGVLGFGVMLSVAADNLFIVYGVWFESAFHLKVAALGFTAVVIGCAELVGEGITAILSDRMGPSRALTLGVILSAASYFLLPLAEQSLIQALVALFVVFVTFEFSMVTTFTLCTELLPDARATMMGGFYTAAAVGRVLGGLAGASAWSVGGIRMVAAISCGATLLGLVSLRWGLSQRQK